MSNPREINVSFLLLSNTAASTHLRPPKTSFSIKIYLKKAELARRRIQSECDSTEQLVQSATEQLSQELQEAANQAADALSNELEEAENDAQLETSTENSATASLPLPIPALPNKVKKYVGRKNGPWEYLHLSREDCKSISDVLQMEQQ